MNIHNNVIPKDVKSIHLIAVCGTGMGALACILMELGYDVSGSDQTVYPPMSDFLMEKGIKLIDGYHEDNLSFGPDLVIVGNAVKKDNPEVLKMFEKNIPFCSMPQALNHFAGEGKKTIVIAGTHGKTTTSSLMSWVLYDAGLDPSFMVGGILKNFDSNFRIGNGDYLVVEGDEYDTAFFDKESKFFHFDPYISILTSIEFDHADIFSDITQIRNTFDKFISGMPLDSKLIANSHDRNIEELIEGRANTVLTYGKKEDANWQTGPIRVETSLNIFDVYKDGELFGNFKLPMVGEYNVLNALSVIAASDSLGIPANDIKSALESFEGAKRRQEIRGVKRGVTVLDDFAHHPTAVYETVKGVKSFYSDKRVIAVFEPRTNSSKRNIFQKVYPNAFEFADIVCISEPQDIEKIPENERFSSEKLVADLQLKDIRAHLFKSVQDIIDFIVNITEPGDIVLVMSSGGFENIHTRLLEKL